MITRKNERDKKEKNVRNRERDICMTGCVWYNKENNTAYKIAFWSNYWASQTPEIVLYKT